MKKLVLIFCLFSLNVTFADDAELNQTLVRVVNQLNAIFPLLIEAETQIEPNKRITLHINSFEGADGKKHAGLRDDIKTIRNSLIDFINRPAIEPKNVTPLQFDFIGK